MSGKTDPTTVTTRGCERGEELVAYLYGEATKPEAALFRQHLDACGVCREELTAFGGVRAGLGDWRAQALGTVPSLNLVDAFATATEPRPTVQRRSARAALREFFSLSPPWLRAGAFAATLAVCALFALTLARAEIRWGSDGLAFRAGVTEKVVTEKIQVPTQVGYTDEQVNAIVARKVAEATAQSTAEAKEQERAQRPDTVINVSGGGKSQQQPTTSTRRKRPSRVDTRRVEPLIAEDDLPRLSDLLSGSY